MSPAERPLGSATIDHVALSVGDIDAMITFYTALGFYEIARSAFAPSPIRSALLQNDIGARLEVTAHVMSVPVIPQVNAAGAAEQRGIFHFAMRVDDLELAVSGGRGRRHFDLSSSPELPRRRTVRVHRRSRR